MTKFAWASMVALTAAWGCGVSSGDEQSPTDESFTSTGTGYGEGAPSGSTSGGYEGVTSSAASGGFEGGDSGAPGEPGGSPQAGQLTAGVWDDNRNFEFFETYLAKHAQDEGRLDFTDEEVSAAHARSLETSSAHTALDIAFVIDTTSSMSDELAYLKAEVASIAGHIAERYPNASQRWALVAYRDEGDSYLVSPKDFAPLDSFAQSLSQLNANGGGDFPEAPDAAFEATAQLSWQSDDAARLVFWLADAPHHVQNAKNFAGAVRDLVAKDAHVYPIASSGVDGLAELTMRASAQLTNGRYVFLTDDSGIGGEHKEPEIPCYFVTRLDQAIERMVDIEMTGHYVEPNADDILRTGGDPQDGACQLESTTVFAF